MQKGIQDDSAAAGIQNHGCRPPPRSPPPPGRPTVRAGRGRATTNQLGAGARRQDAGQRGSLSSHPSYLELTKVLRPEEGDTEEIPLRSSCGSGQSGIARADREGIIVSVGFWQARTNKARRPLRIGFHIVVRSVEGVHYGLLGSFPCEPYPARGLHPGVSNAGPILISFAPAASASRPAWAAAVIHQRASFSTVSHRDPQGRTECPRHPK